MLSAHGTLLLTPPSIVILHAKPNTTGQQSGLSWQHIPGLEEGRFSIMDPWKLYASFALLPSCLPTYSPISQRVCRKKYSVVGGFLPASEDRGFIFLISSAIIEDIKNMREDNKSACASVAYYYFDQLQGRLRVKAKCDL